MSNVGPGGDPVGGATPRVVVVAEGHLVGETIVLALEAQEFDVQSIPVPRSRIEIVETRRRLMADEVDLGVVVAEVDDVNQWRDVLALVEGVRMPWLLVTGSSSEARWGGLIAAGCLGIVQMSAGLDALVRAVRAVVADEPPMDPVSRASALAAWHDVGPERRDVIRRIAALSQREWEVLGLLNDGLSTLTIAENGGVSEGTVRSQVRAIRQKLNVRSQLAAVAAYQAATEFGRTVPTQRASLDDQMGSSQRVRRSS